MKVKARTWWDDGRPCDDDGLAFCSRCKPRDLPAHLFVTEGTGGHSFHCTRNCRGLVEGQQFIEDRGGTPAKVLMIDPKQAAMTGRFPCLVCMPGWLGRLNR